MNRRKFLSLTGIGPASLSVAGCTTDSTTSTETPRQSLTQSTKVEQTEETRQDEPTIEDDSVSTESEQNESDPLTDRTNLIFDGVNEVSATRSSKSDLQSLKPNQGYDRVEYIHFINSKIGSSQELDIPEEDQGYYTSGTCCLEENWNQTYRNNDWLIDIFDNSSFKGMYSDATERLLVKYVAGDSIHFAGDYSNTYIEKTVHPHQIFRFQTPKEATSAHDNFIDEITVNGRTHNELLPRVRKIQWNNDGTTVYSFVKLYDRYILVFNAGYDSWLERGDPDSDLEGRLTMKRTWVDDPL